MDRIVNLATQPDGEATINVALDRFEAPMKTALYRAAIFLGYAAHSSAAPPLSSIKLQSSIHLEVGVPDPIPLADRTIYQNEFRSWAVGQGLIELDQNYQRFVVSALELVDDIRHFIKSRTSRATHKTNLANTWGVHDQFFGLWEYKLPRHSEDSAFLRSLGNARNCLAHDSGVVTSRRLNQQGQMPVRWRGHDMFQKKADGTLRLLPRDGSFIVKAADVGLEISSQEVVREYVFRAGQRINFSELDLSEIIFFYQALAVQVGIEIHRFVGDAAKALNS